MKRLVFFISFLFCLSLNENSFAGRKIQWEKFLNDTTVSYPSHGWSLNGAVTDVTNNLYTSWVPSYPDSSIPFITKYTSEGEKKWQVSIFPLPLDSNAYEIEGFDTQKLYWDIDSNLVLVLAAFDTIGRAQYNADHRFILFAKLDQNGNLLKVYKDYLPYKNNFGFLSDIRVNQLGEIHLINLFDFYTSLDFSFRKYNKNFDLLFSKDQVTPLLGNSEHLSSKPYCVVKDSLMVTAYSTTQNVSTNSLYLFQLNLNTGDTVWHKIIQSNQYNLSPTQMEVSKDNLYLCSYHMFKFDFYTGALIIEDNRMYMPIKFMIDTSENKIFCINNYGTYRTMTIFDTNLTLTNILKVPYWPTEILKKDSIISVVCYEESLTQQFMWNRIELIRINPQNVIVDSLFYTLPDYCRGYSGSVNLVNDHENNIFLLHETSSYPYYDSLSRTMVCNPIFLQKICYNCVDDLKGRVYFDSQPNLDCTFDSTEAVVENNMIHLLPEDIYTTTDSNGFYSFVKPTGIATIEYIPKFSSTFLCNSSNSYTVNMANGVNDTLDFGLRIKVPTIDASCSINAGVARPGFQHYIILEVENNSTQRIFNSTLNLITDTLFTFVNSSVIPDSLAGNKLFWNIDTMNPGEIKYYIIQTFVNAPINHAFIHTASVSVANDNNLSNNVDTISGIVTGSFDPNHKLANPIGIGPQHYIENTQTIDYYIEFQNTGTDTAFNIKITDILDDDLDITTLSVTGSSHPMKYKLQGRELTFYFDNVLLVDSNRDYDKSIGFLTYSIKPKKLADGNKITNSASIYFDFNEPIITNTTFHTIGRPGSYFDNDALDDFNFFPNPVKDEMLTVTVNLVSGTSYSLSLTDITGKSIGLITANDIAIGKHRHFFNLINKVGAGVYFLTLKSGKNTITKKLVVGN